MSTKCIVWIKEGKESESSEYWEPQGDGPLTPLQAERISKEIKKECNCRTKILPVGVDP